MSSRPSLSDPQQAGTVRANLAALGVAEGVARVAQLVIIALLGRVLGPVELGIVGVAWAVFQLAAPFVQYAPELIGARLIAQGVDTRKALIDVTAIKLVVGVLCTAAMVVGAAVVFAHDPAERLQVALQALVPLAVALNGVWAFRGLRRFAAYSVVRCAQSVVLLGGLALVLAAVRAAWIVPVCEAAAGLAAAVLAYGLLLDARDLPTMAAAMYRRGFALRAEIGEAIRFGIGSFFGGAVWTVPLLVGQAFLSPTDQGYLAAALRLILAGTSLYQLALQVFHPVLAHRYAHDRPAGGSLAAALLVYALATTLPVAAVLVVAAPWIVTSILGAAFAPMANVFAMLALAIVPVVVSSVFGYVFIADGRYGLYLWICAGNAAISLVGCVVAFSVRPHADAVGIVTVVATVVAIVGGVAAQRHGLVRFREVRLRQLSPARFAKILMER